MNSPAPRANCFDASALVKVYVDEPGSDIVRGYFYHRAPTQYTTPFCYYESLNVLKVKWFYRHEITKDEYTKAAFELTAWFASRLKYVRDLDFTNPVVFNDVRTIAERHALDLSDAFQILSVKNGYFSHLINDSRTVLITADEKLARVARIEGVKAWFLLGESEP